MPEIIVDSIQGEVMKSNQRDMTNSDIDEEVKATMSMKISNFAG